MCGVHLDSICIICFLWVHKVHWGYVTPLALQCATAPLQLLEDARLKRASAEAIELSVEFELRPRW